MASNKVPRQRILVTGASGCLGHGVACKLAAEGRHVVGIDIRAPDGPVPYTALSGDVNDVHLLYRLFKQHDFDGLIHCGGISGAAVLPDDPYRNCEVNIFGTVHLLEIARQHGGVRLVYASSTGAYGATGAQPVDENAPFQPVSIYGATKAAGDALVRAYRLQHGVDGVSLRIGRVYGPRRRTESIVRDYLRAALARRPLHLAARGGNKLQYVYVDDIVNALASALDLQHIAGMAYNVSGPECHADDQVAALVAAEVAGSVIEYARDEILPTTYGPLLDYSAAQRELGYHPRSLADGIRTFAQWMRADPDSNPPR